MTSPYRASWDPPAPTVRGNTPLTVRLLLAAVTVAAAWLIGRSGPPWRTFATVAVLLVAVPATLADAAFLHRLLHLVRRVVGKTVGAILFVLLGVVAVAIPSILNVVTRTSSIPEHPGFTPRVRRDIAHREVWVHDSIHRTRTSWKRSLAVMAAAVVLALLLPATRERLLGGSDGGRREFSLADEATTADARSDRELIARYGLEDRVGPGVEANDHRTASDNVIARDTWSQDTAPGSLRDAQGWAFQPTGGWRVSNLFRMLDFEGRNISVHDGGRSSWSAPECGCRRITVWMYGGSTTYGLNQRDDHTIASELAREAMAHGLVVDVVNRGNNGHLHWLEASLFAWDLTTRPAPDLVVFYDGVNERWASSAVRQTGGILDAQPIDPTRVDFWNSTGRADGAAPPAPKGAFVADRTRPKLSALGLATLIVERYDRSRRMSATTAIAHGIPAVYFWQPSRYSRPLVPAEPHYDTYMENNNRLIEQLTVRLLPDDVIDLSDSLDGTVDPMFTDDVHHNEEGSRLIAAAMFNDLRAQLTTLARTKREDGAR